MHTKLEIEKVMEDREGRIPSTFVVSNSKVGATDCFGGQREGELVSAVRVVLVNSSQDLN